MGDTRNHSPEDRSERRLNDQIPWSRPAQEF
jgi:hypothetical protein